MESRLEKEKASKFVGTIKLYRRYTTVKWDAAGVIQNRALEATAIANLVKRFQTAGLERMDPRNFMTATISPEELSRFLESIGMTNEQLKNASANEDYPLITPEIWGQFNGSRFVLQAGQHRFAALAQIRPDINDRWWPTRLYLSTISIDAIFRLRENLNEVHKGLNDGETLLRLAEYQRGLDDLPEWGRGRTRAQDEECAKLTGLFRLEMTGFGPGSYSRAKRVWAKESFREAILSALKIPGVRATFCLGGLREIMTLQCLSIICDLLNEIAPNWTAVFGDYANLLNQTHVSTLSGLNPKFIDDQIAFAQALGIRQNGRKCLQETSIDDIHGLSDHDDDVEDESEKLWQQPMTGLELTVHARSKIYNNWIKHDRVLLNFPTLSKASPMYTELNVLLSHISMWSNYSKISRVKSKKPFTKRFDVSKEMGLGFVFTDVVISFACDLLPFFNPSKEIATFTYPRDRPAAYLKLLQREPVFKALCYFLQSTPGFAAATSLEEGMLQMANDFISAKNGLFQVRDNSDITPVLRALRSCHPIGLTRFAAASVAERLEPAILVAYASEMDPKFKTAQQNLVKRVFESQKECQADEMTMERLESQLYSEDHLKAAKEVLSRCIPKAKVKTIYLPARIRTECWQEFFICSGMEEKEEFMAKIDFVNWKAVQGNDRRKRTQQTVDGFTPPAPSAGIKRTYSKMLESESGSESESESESESKSESERESESDIEWIVRNGKRIPIE